MRPATKLLLLAMVALMFLLHQDFWNWRRYEPLVFGFVPVGLAYHAAYSVMASVMMAILVRFAWPKHLEDVQPYPSSIKPGNPRHPQAR